MEEELTYLATTSFQNKKYGESIKYLKQLLEIKKDQRILHNIAVAEYYLSKENKNDNLNSILNDTIQQNKSLINDTKVDLKNILLNCEVYPKEKELKLSNTDEKEEKEKESNTNSSDTTTANTNNKTNSNSNTNTNTNTNENNINEKDSYNETNLDLAENRDENEFDVSDLSSLPTLISDNVYEIYNKAIAYYNEKKYNEAANVLEPIYVNIDVLDNYIALKIGFLLIDIYIVQKNFERAFLILEITNKIYQQYQTEINNYKNLCKNNSNNNNTSNMGDTNGQSNINSVEDQDQTKNSNENIEKVNDENSDLKSISENKKRIKTPDIKMAIPQKFKNFYSFYYFQKARIYIASKNMEEAKKNINLSLKKNKNIETEITIKKNNDKKESGNEKESESEIKLNETEYLLSNAFNNMEATIEYKNGNNLKAFQNLNSQENLEDYVLNNLGCISYKEKRYSMAANFLLKALKNNENKISKMDQIKSDSISNINSTIFHNLQLQLMLNNDFETATQCLLQDTDNDGKNKATLRNVLYWFRSGENLLRTYKKKIYNNDPTNRLQIIRLSPEITFGLINSNMKPKTPLNNDKSFEELQKINYDDYKLPSQIPNDSKLILKNSFICFQKSRKLIEEIVTQLFIKKNNEVEKDTNNIPSEAELKHLDNLLKLNIAYIYLEYNQYELVLNTLNELLLVNINNIKNINDTQDSSKNSLLTMHIIARIFVSQAFIGFKLYNDAYSMISTDILPSDLNIDKNIEAILYLCQASTLCWSISGKINYNEGILNEAEQSLKKFYSLAYSYLNIPPTYSSQKNLEGNELSNQSEETANSNNNGNKNSIIPNREDFYVLNSQLFVDDAKMLQAWIDMKRKDYESALKHLS